MQPPYQRRLYSRTQAKPKHYQQAKPVHKITGPLSYKAHHCTRNHKPTGQLTHTKPIHD